METIRLSLEEIAGDWFGWMEDYPGAYSQGATPQAAIQAAPGALIDYVHWLRDHGESLPPLLARMPTVTARTEVVEMHPTRFAEEGLEENACLACDARPMNNDELDLSLRLLGYARLDLRKVLKALSPEEWDRAPLGGRSVRSILQHLLRTEQYYLACLPGDAPTTNGDIPAALETVRIALDTAARAFPEEKRGTVFTVKSERWTLRKVLRRALWHERYHTVQIAVRSNPAEFLRSLAVVNLRLREEGVPTGIW